MATILFIIYLQFYNFIEVSYLFADLFMMFYGLYTIISSPKMPLKINVCCFSAITKYCVYVFRLYLYMHFPECACSVAYFPRALCIIKFFHTYVIYMQISCYTLFIWFFFSYRLQKKKLSPQK